MRTMKKTIAFVLAFAMAFATAFSAIGAKTTASAEGSAFGVEVYPNGYFTASNFNKEVQVAAVTVKNGTASLPKVWDIYPELDSRDIDGNITFNPKKDQYYAFRTVSSDGASYTDPVFVQVKKNAEKVKAVVTPSGDAYKVSLSGYTGSYVLMAGGYELMDEPLSGDAVIDNENGAEFLRNGSTLEAVPIGDVVSADATTVKFNGVDCSVTSAVKANAKSIKVKIKKMANAPKVSINFKTGVANIPKDCYYRVISGNASWSGDFTKVSSKTAVDITSCPSGIVQVYKAATTKAIISKTGVATFAQSAINSAQVTYTYASSDGLTIKNNTGADIEYCISTSAPTSATKWTSIKSTKTEVKLKANKVPASGSKLYVRGAANAKKLLIPGVYTTIDYAATKASADASGNGSGS